MTLKNHVPSDNFNRAIHKRRRRKDVESLIGNIEIRLPLQITNDSFAVQLFFGSSFR
uniref:Uncharacterized protein n=1 Tax=Rhizophagus irregularis (strain DAOM 181602 / DAOM 197198 / MUCL 43194) TaxID=747089 RepID=U9TI19_RHIID